MDRTAEFINVGTPNQIVNSPNPMQLNDTIEGEGFLIEEATQVEVYNLTKELNPKKSLGLPDLSPTIVKNSQRH